VLKSSIKLSGNEFQTVGVARQKAQLPNTVVTQKIIHYMVHN